MQIILNGTRTNIPQEISLSKFLSSMEFDFTRIVVEHNYNIARKENWENIILKDGDNIEVLSFVGGG